MPVTFRKHLPIAASFLAVAGLASSAIGQAKPAETKTIELTLTPRSAPDPVLRYRLLPLESERTPGDAVPIYLRLSCETKDEATQQINANSSKWLDSPIGEFPVAEARKFVNQFPGKLKQMEYGARRQTANWNYTLPEEKEHAIEILLPDAQELRAWTRLLAIKARVEIAEKKYDEAIRTIETGLSMSRHLAEGPFLINSLVGIAGATQFLNRLEELITQPDAPNLYWALTALPRPLIGIRKQMETEQTMMEGLLPEINDLDAPRTDAEWTSRLARLHGRWNGLAKLMDIPTEAMQSPNAPHVAPAVPVKPSSNVDRDFAKFQSETLPEARAFAKAHGVSIEGLSDAHVIMLYIGGQYREIRDRSFAPSYLPYPDAVPLYAAVDAKNKSVKGPIPTLFAAFAPALVNAESAQVRLDRRVAILRVIEALRLQAAASNGTLPKSLDAVNVAPIPLDPATGRAFDLRRDGDAVVLNVPGIPAGHPNVSYRISLRK
ncbi:MAG: hypothetical protein JWN86_4008 [Planctomycetota bacterium]|nr:hypothetical protein [Planctomycetota bacterium]